MLSKLASLRNPSAHSLGDPLGLDHEIFLAVDANDPRSLKSLLIVPVNHRRSIAGALVVFSVEFNAFTSQDALNARLLCGLLGQALGKAAEAELMQSIGLERATMLQAIDELIPALKKLTQETQEFHGATNNVSSSFTAPEVALTTKSPGTALEEPVGGALRDPDSSLAPSKMADGTELDSLVSLIAYAEEDAHARELADSSSPQKCVSSQESRGPSISTCDIEVRSAPTGLRQKSPFWAMIGLSGLANKQRDKSKLWVLTKTNRRVGFPSLGGHQRGMSGAPGFRVKLRMLSKAALPIAILMLVSVFAFLITGANHPSNVVAANPATSVGPNRVPGSEATSGLQQLSGLKPGAQLSHMRITEPALLFAVQNLSRYELAGLKREAAYGDDSAALLLGMAYETGHLVPQDCVKAGEWVAQSAEEGNAAAQYNLGLRYKQGDGVPVDRVIAAMWLRRAASQNDSRASLVLESDR